MDALQRNQMQAQAASGRSPLRSFAPYGAVIALAAVVSALHTGAGFAVLLLGLSVCTIALRLSAPKDQSAPVEPETPVRRVRANAQQEFIALGDQSGRGQAVRTRPTAPMAPEQPTPAAQPSGPESAYEIFAAGGSRQFAAGQQSALLDLIAKTEARIAKIDPLVAQRMHKNRKNELESILRAKQITAALITRCALIEQALEQPDWSEDEERRVWSLCYGTLELKRDAMSALMSDEGQQSILLCECAKVLEEIFTLLARRKTFFKALRSGT